MLSPWQYVRSWFARVGSDPYYASYERSLSNIKAEVDRVQAARVARQKAWAHIRARFLGGFAAAYTVILAFAAYVNRQPHGTYTPKQQAVRVAPAFLAPLLGWLAHRLLSWLQAVLDRRSAARVKLLESKLRKQVVELKDSTRYERTLALLQKYDPDYAPPKPQQQPPALAPGSASRLQRGGRATAAAAAGSTAPTPVSRAAGAAVNVAGSALQGAGALMFPALAQLYSRAAGTLIADDPVMLNLLREAQQQADLLRQRLLVTEGQAVQLLRDNIALKQQLGLPTEEEQAALEAWMGGGNGNGGGGSGNGAGGPTATAAVGPVTGSGVTEGEQQQAAPEPLALPPATREAGAEEAGVQEAAGAAVAAADEQAQSEPGEQAQAEPAGSGSKASRRRRGSSGRA